MAELSKYQKEVARAKSRGFTSPYQERKFKAQQMGFSSVRAQRSEREFWSGKKRDTRAEYYRAKALANEQGFRSVRDRQQAKKLGLTGEALQAWQKRRVLEYFGISENTLKRVRTENRKWSRENPSLQWTSINTYDLKTDERIRDWSEQRIGYILAFHAAIVNPKTNYDSLVDKDGRRTFINGKRRTNKSQFYYLVKYGGLMQVDEFEARYGKTAILAANKDKVKP